MIDHLTWNALPDPAAAMLAARALYEEEDPARLGSVRVTGGVADLPFYPTLVLAHLTLQPPGAPALELFLLTNDDDVFVLDGTSAPVHRANREDEVRVTEETAIDYLRFFCFAVRGDAGPFLLFEKPAIMPAADDALFPIAALAQPVELERVDEAGTFVLKARVHYEHGLYDSRFAVTPQGATEMVDDELLLADVTPAVIPDVPDLFPAEAVASRLETTGAVTPSGAAILRTLVELLLEQALRQQADTRLIAHFNARLTGGTVLERFARAVTTAAPVVAIESTLPFIEETVAQIARDHAAAATRVRWIESDVDPSDDTRLRVQVPESGPAVVLLPFHAYRAIVDAERVAHEIGARDVGCLIGCERVRDLPAGLRQVVDVTLRLPRLDAAAFAALFRRVMGDDPPAGWQDEDTHWVTHVHHSDFQHPRSLGLSPAETLAYIRERAQKRLRDLEPATGIALRDLHGLGEARIFAEDLITDVREAIAGRLAWRQVDHGVLLVGAPGTGKTTLARAIAKECGIRFVSASAASWQAAGHLGDHIRAMRADFALARRFAPAILFVDEIDSLGNRETFSGANAQYLTEVVNALLEQMQGLDPEAPVIVIAATNHADRVDPALRRAGRLDRVIEIPRPSAEALSQIFQQYLAEYEPALLGPDIDVRTLGGLTLGLTGADVELFVRGAARRARRGGHPIRQTELIAEITSKPRDPASSPRLTPAEVRRVAVHEAGHALAAFLGSTQGEEISFVTIVPRADGTLGFVARTPPARVLVTRREYLERLEVILAGRAAEEIVFGMEGITGGAQDDLRVGTESALLLTTQYGLGPDNKLLWSSSPSASQIDEASRVLTEAYAAVLARLRAAAPQLAALADALLAREELTGVEARAVLREGAPAGASAGTAPASPGAPPEGAAMVAPAAR
ncbi:MAG TPA: AAA family ATPase [Longimicrobiales bacterium]|nr:AAA family ATPase [Longimicrobiales bacterium]